MQSIDWKTGLGVEIVAPKRPSLKAEINKLEKSVHKDIIKAMAMPPNWLGDRRFFKTQGGEPVGTTHTWKDGKKYQKQQDGTWKEMSSGKQSGKKEEGDGEGRKKEGGPGMSADQLREALKQYHIKKDEFNGGFLLKIGPKNGVDGENYIGEDGKPGEYNDSKTFESKEEVKQFIKDKIVPMLEKKHANKESKEDGGSKDPKKVSAPDFDENDKLIEDGDSTDFVATDEGAKLIGSPEAFKKEYADYKIDKTDKVIVNDLNSGKDWMDFDLVDAIKKRKDLWDGKKLTPIGEKAFIDVLKTSDKQGYENFRDDIESSNEHESSIMTVKHLRAKKKLSNLSKTK